MNHALLVGGYFTRFIGNLHGKEEIAIWDLELAQVYSVGEFGCVDYQTSRLPDAIVHYALRAPIAHNGASIELFGV